MYDLKKLHHKQTSLKAQIYEKIFRMILDNEFSREDLIVEGQLMKMFNVSRAPVREALIELCRENILRNIPRSGYQIVRISGKEMRDAFRFRLILELEGLKMGFPHYTEQNIADLKAIAEETDEARNLGKESSVLELKMKLNTKFHFEISKLSGNQLMHQSLQKTMTLLTRGIAQIMIHENELPLPEQTFHMGIVRALEEGDLEKASEKLKCDIETYEKEFWENVNMM